MLAGAIIAGCASWSARSKHASDTVCSALQCPSTSCPHPRPYTSPASNASRAATTGLTRYPRTASTPFISGRPASLLQYVTRYANFLVESEYGDGTPASRACGSTRLHTSRRASSPRLAASRTDSDTFSRPNSSTSCDAVNPNRLTILSALPRRSVPSAYVPTLRHVVRSPRSSSSSTSIAANPNATRCLKAIASARYAPHHVIRFRVVSVSREYCSVT